MEYEIEFSAEMWRWSTVGWHFVTVPAEHGPSSTLAWGRAPVTAEVDGHAWKTSVWREKSGRTVLPIPKAARGEKGEGDCVKVRLSYSML